MIAHGNLQTRRNSSPLAVSNRLFDMNEKRTRSWPVAELVPPILLGLVGLNILLAAPTRIPASTKVPKTPRLSPQKPPPANKFVLFGIVQELPLSSSACQRTHLT